MRNKYNEWLSEQTPEEIADHEFRVLTDTKRIKRMNLVRALQQAIDDNNIEEIRELFPDLITVLALFKRSEITMRVLVRRVRNYT